MLDKRKGIKLFIIYSNKSPMIILNTQSVLLHLESETKEKKSFKKCKGMKLKLYFFYQMNVSQL